jgi:ABC-type sugar transport system ATPase subunit
MASLTLNQINKSYGTVPVLHGVDLEIKRGEFVVFVGPSGCGKSTLLRIIAGLEDITGGTMMIDGAVMNTVPPAKRGIAMVFQSYALYPHMTVFENMAFGLRLAHTEKSVVVRQVTRAAEMLQLTPYLERLPRELSGGQRQRVAIGRAITRDPRIFLFDEPLSNLDAALRVATRIEIAKLKKSMPDTTMIYVTHDQVEAMTLADRIVVLRDGRVEQVGTPIELYLRPANAFVAQFIGSPAMNLLDGKLLEGGSAGSISIDGGGKLAFPFAGPTMSTGSAIKVGIRPEDLVLAKDRPPIVSGKADIVEKLGEVTLVYLSTPGGAPLVAKLDGIVSVSPGDQVELAVDPNRVHVFSEAGAALERLK